MASQRGLTWSFRAWAKELAIFPPDVAGALGRLVQRLAPALDSIDLRPRRGDGEPDGFDGLARRGIYERLLLSEWPMAEEIPEELERRAVEGELAFLELARVEPASSRLSVVLFDAGPSQLGTPRIAHIAALVVLARRAERARAELKWGVLQRAEGPLHGSLTAENVLGLLAARDFREAVRSHLEAWRARLTEHRGLEELWLVGSARLERVLRPRGALQVQVGDALDPDVRQLRVCLRQSARTVAELRLDLPEPPACVRLLRDPFETSQARRELLPGAHAPASNFFFAATGAHLLARSAGKVVRVAREEPEAMQLSLSHEAERSGGQNLLSRAKVEPLIIVLVGHPGGDPLHVGFLEGPKLHPVQTPL